MKFKSLIAFLTAIAPASVALAGSNTAELTCQSESGRTKLKALVWDITGSLESLQFEIDGKSWTVGPDAVGEEGIHLAVVSDAKSKVYTLSLAVSRHGSSHELRYVHLTLHAFPDQFEVLKSTGDAESYAFRGRVSGTDPRDGNNSPRIEVDCKLDYAI